MNFGNQGNNVINGMLCPSKIHEQKGHVNTHQEEGWLNSRGRAPTRHQPYWQLDLGFLVF